MNTNITGANLLTIGYSEGKIVGLALNIIAEHFIETNEAELLALLKKVKNYLSIQTEIRIF